MLVSNRFVVIFIDLWSRWKFLVPATLLLFIMLVAISSVSLIPFTFGMLASFCFHQGARDSKKILLTPHQAEFLTTRCTVGFCNRLADRLPATIHDLWEALKEQEEAEQEAAEAAVRLELVRIFNPGHTPFDYDAAKAAQEQTESQE